MEQGSQEFFTVPFDAAKASDYGLMGGKCSSLARMIAAGVNVPAGFAVTTNAYQEHLRSNELEKKIAATLASIDANNVEEQERKALELRRAIASAQMPAAVEAALRQAYRVLAPANDLPVAVRSSATAEDLPDASFAGQQDTYLWVVGADDVVAKVKDCWASLYNARAISYRAKHEVDQLDVLISVGVQTMVDAIAAGVAMTLDPLTGDRTKIVIDSAFGLGEPVVSGEITPDNFVVEKVLLEITKRKIVEKADELVADRLNRTTVKRVVDAPRRSAPSLTDAEVIAVAQLAKSLERLMGSPQDVEWAIDRNMPGGKNLVALQSRPETVWSQRRGELKRSYALGVEGVVGTLLSPLETNNKAAAGSNLGGANDGSHQVSESI